MMVVNAKVRRDAALATLPMEQLVPGDIVNIEAGNLLPADRELLTNCDARIGEFGADPGESMPVPSRSTPSLRIQRFGDRIDLAFMNTQVTRGAGTLLVTNTGMATEVGRISGMLQVTEDEITPLTRQLNRLTNQILVIAGVALLVLIGLGLWQNARSTCCS